MSESLQTEDREASLGVGDKVIAPGWVRSQKGALPGFVANWGLCTWPPAADALEGLKKGNGWVEERYGRVRRPIRVKLLPDENYGATLYFEYVDEP